MKIFVKNALDFIGAMSNFLFFLAQLYFFLFFVYILLATINPNLVSMLAPLYADVVKSTSVSIQNNMSEAIVFAVFSFMLLFIRNFLVLTYDNFCTNTLNRFSYIDAQIKEQEILNISNNKKKYLEDLNLMILVKINFEIYKSFFDDENEKTEEEIISIKKNILAQISSALAGYQIFKSVLSNDLYSAVILNINKLQEITLKLNNIKMMLPSKYGSSNIKIDLTIVLDEFYNDDNFKEKVFLMNKIPNIIKKSEFISTSNLENTLSINPELKEKYRYLPIGTYSLTTENGNSKDYDLSIMKFKNS